VYSKELEVAKEISFKVAKYQLEKQDSLKHINLKEDKSPFTEVDTTSEDMIRAAFAEAFPEDGFFGEESGKTKGTSGRQWIVDPLDGTRPYIHKIPTFSILIGLEEDGKIVAGVVNFPALNECYWATKGGGAFCNGEPISVSKTEKVEEAMGSSLGLTESADTESGKKLYSFMQKWDYVYGFMDAYSYMGVASGKLDLCISLIDYPWDRAPAAIIVEEAGGKFSSLKDEKSIYGDSFIVSNGLVHSECLKAF
jgi:histidinol-phosphatase